MSDVTVQDMIANYPTPNSVMESFSIYDSEALVSGELKTARATYWREFGHVVAVQVVDVVCTAIGDLASNIGQRLIHSDAK